MDTLVLLFGALGGLGGLGGIAAVLYIRPMRSKITAEARKVDVDAEDVLAGRALEMYDRAIAASREAGQEAQACRAEVHALRDHVDHLGRIMRDAGMTPPPFVWPKVQA